ncbi:MAG: alkaline phosphatase, partial [Clostridia bacterium]|nr:alkaline phosphatase [Clostridia bacterium]
MRIKKLLALLLTLMMLMTSFAITATTVSAATPQIKNIIFMIPDGGSMASFNLADAVKQAGGIKSSVAPYATKQTVNYMYMKDYLIGSEKTYCADNAVTDSAAAGTALAGGYKTNTYHIGLKPDQTPSATLIEVAQSKGMKTGMVATFEFSNATPAAFSAHESHRDHYPAISRQIAYQGIDVVLGGGFSKSEWPEAQSTVASLGYNIIDNRAELNAVKKGDKIWGNLFSGQAASDHQNTANDVTLAEMTTAAIRALENDNGFFLMVEGSNVDGGGHDNNALEMVGEYIAFDEACKIAVEYAKGRNDTMVIMMPDHDTGGMNVINQATAVANIQNGVIPGTSAVTWDSKQHTARNGGVFLYAPAGVAYPEGLSTNPGVASNFDNYVVENTIFAPYLADIMGVDTVALNQDLFVNVTSIGSYAPYTVNYNHRNLGHAMSSNEHTGIFTFNGVNASIERNTSILTYNGQKIDLDGQVSVYENGKFYVPYKALEILGLDVPDQGGSGSEIPKNVITTESLYSMGTAGSLWGDVDQYNGATGSGDSITLQPGGYVTFKVPVPKAGIYYLEVKSSGGNTTLEAQMNYKYVAEIPVSAAEGSYYQNAEGGYEFLYGARGSNKMQLTNTGSEAVTITSVGLMASQIAVDNGVTPTIQDVKTVSGNYDEGDAIYSTNAPYAGVYQVTSDKAVTITNETGHTATLAAGVPQYFYLIKGANSITKSDNTATLKFTVLANNGIGYIGQVNAGSAPLANTHSDQVAIPGGTNLAVGAEATVTLNVPVSGIYYISLQSPDKKVSTIYMESDTGYYGEMTPYTGNLQYAVNEANPKELITMYLRAGTTTLTLKNLGAGVANLQTIQVKQTQELTGIAAYIPQLNIAHCKVVEYAKTEEPTPTPTATPTPTTAPTVTPGPEGWREGDVASVSNAPYAGVYKVYSDKAVTITNETGHTATLQPGVSKYFYLIKGANNITKSDSTANLTFTVLKDNGMDYINNVNAGTAPTHDSNTYFGPAASAGGATTSSFVASTTGSATASGDTITLAPGASVTFQGNIATAGLYYIQVQFTADGSNKLDLETSSGHYAQINQHRTGWNYYYDISTYDMDPVYMRSGVETLTITNTGSATCSFTGIRFARTSSTDIAYAMKLANCKVIPVAVGDAPANPTPIPTATPVPTPA